MRQAKIVCTIGPATNTPENLKALIEAGMDVARINRSHGNQEEDEKTIAKLREAAKDRGKPLAILVDLQGPKIRLGTFAKGKEDLRIGDTFTITTREVDGTKDIVGTTFDKLPGDCNVGDTLLIDDGNISLRVKEVTETDVITTVTVPGTVSNHKGLNLPGVAVSVPALTEKDEQDLRWALHNDVDFIALSFVRSADDYNDVKRIMDEEGIWLPVIAKIEKPQAVDNLDQIMRTFDGAMVARGDLGVEMPLEQVPIVQKRAIDIARQRAKPVIVATQVLDSMIQSPRPTRAEASDCANAILDGADAVMLSGETSIGAYPIEAVRTMASIVRRTETRGREYFTQRKGNIFTKPGIVTKAAVEMAAALGFRNLAIFTSSGDSAKRVSRLRPALMAIALTPHARVRNQLCLSWGVHPILVGDVHDTDEMVDVVDEQLQKHGIVKEGEDVIIVAGMPPGRSGSTNMIRIHEIGDKADY
ncbi:MAG: pyruvate kinase [Actinomycetaceae bacterium]|nr:pyruvate kinase [Actinomycetaceae bacterium]